MHTYVAIPYLQIRMSQKKGSQYSLIVRHVIYNFYDNDSSWHWSEGSGYMHTVNNVRLDGFPSVDIKTTPSEIKLNSLEDSLD